MSNHHNVSRKTAEMLILFITLLIIITVAIPASGNSLTLHDEPLSLPAAPNCRFGIVPFGSDQGAKLSEFGVGWYLNFNTNPVNTAPSNVEFVPVIRLKQVKSGDTYLDDYTVSPPLTDTELGAKIDANQGATWIVGNEPDRGPSPGSSPQDDLQPEMYARALHDVYEYIKDRDPSAKIAIAGLVEITPGRLQYLDKVSAAYHTAYGTEIQADVWNMHLYIMPEIRPNGELNDIASVAVGTDPALGMRETTGQNEAHLCGNPDNGVYCWADHDNLTFFERQVRDMRTWMKQHGQQNKPLLISEFSILYGYETLNGQCEYLQDEFGKCFTPTRVSNYLSGTFDLINGLGEMTDMNIGYPQDEYRLVQQAMWFSMYFDYAGKSSNLYSNEALIETTLVGQTFQDEIMERNPVPNLLPWEAASLPGFIVPPATTATVTLSADIYNNGSTAVTTPISVTFYSDAALTNEIGTAVVDNLNGCARGPVSVSVEWGGLTGLHHYWVKTDNNNDTASGIVIIDPEQIFLPAVLR